MNYIVCEKPNQFLLKEKEEPEANPGEAILQIHRVGICGTDLHAYIGDQAFFNYPRILGHELAAEIVQVYENEQQFSVGDKVIVMPYVSCGSCVACENGKTNCCVNIQVLGVHTDGGMQEKIAVRTDLLLPANQLSYEEMAIVEPLAIGAHAIRRAKLKAEDTVVVMGCGPIGIGLMKLAQIKGAKVIAMDMNEDRLQFVQSEIGVQHVVNVLNEPIEKVKKLTDGHLADIVFDATGNRKALETGPDYMAHGGTYVLVGLSNGQITYDHPTIHAKETTLLCSRNATMEDFQFVIKHLNQFPTESFITHQVHFKEMLDQFSHWLDPENGVIKAMVQFS